MTYNGKLFLTMCYLLNYLSYFAFAGGICILRSVEHLCILFSLPSLIEFPYEIQENKLNLITCNTLPISLEAVKALWWCWSSAIFSPCWICLLWMSRISVCCLFWVALRFCICVPWFSTWTWCWFCASLRFWICVPWFCNWIFWWFCASLRFCICVPCSRTCVCCWFCVSLRFCITDSWKSCLLPNSPKVKKHKQ